MGALGSRNFLRFGEKPTGLRVRGRRRTQNRGVLGEGQAAEQVLAIAPDPVQPLIDVGQRLLLPSAPGPGLRLQAGELRLPVLEARRLSKLDFQGLTICAKPTRLVRSISEPEWIYFKTGIRLGLRKLSGCRPGPSRCIETDRVTGKTP